MFIETVSVKDDHGLGDHLQRGRQKKSQESQYFLKEEPVIFADRMDVGHERVESDSKLFGLSNSEDRTVIDQDGRD